MELEFLARLRDSQRLGFRWRCNPTLFNDLQARFGPPETSAKALTQENAQLKSLLKSSTKGKVTPLPVHRLRVN